MVFEHERLLAKIANMHYIEDRSQTEIASLLGLSKSKVCRMLSEARSSGVVRIYINGAYSWCPALESALERKYGLREACIVEVASEQAVSRTLGGAGAQLVKRLISPRDILGISWGRTLLSLVSDFHPSTISGPQVVQVAGCLNMGGEDMQALELLRRLGECFGTQPLALFCPSIVVSPQVKRGLLEDPKISGVFEAAKRCTIMLAGIGEIGETATLFQQGYVDPEWRSALAESGAVGDLCLNFYNADGEACCPSFQDVTMTAVTLEDLRKIPSVVAVAGGRSKVDAIRGALKSGVLNILVTDKNTAEALL